MNKYSVMAHSVYVLWFCLYSWIIRTGPVAALVIIVAPSLIVAIGKITFVNNVTIIMHNALL